MAENKAICEFADKWNRKFRSPETSSAEVECKFGPECKKLGFQMDCGEAFRNQFGEKAFYNAAEFQKIADDIQDEMLLGSALFSKWRYCTHWTGEPILSDENRAWFREALYRLSVLTGEGWKKSWTRQAQKENPVLRDVMMKTLEQYLKKYPEG